MSWKYYKPKFEYEEKFQDLEWPWAGHKNFAYDLTRNTKPKVIVELGTHKGTSFFSFCQAVKDGKIGTSLYAVDTWKGDEHSGFYDESVFEEVKEIKDVYYKNLDIRLLRKTFDEAVADFENESIDILHIDGLHTYEAVKHDFENWFSKVKTSGMILLHDTAEKREDFGVYILWEDLKKKYKTIDFFHSHGIGMMFKGKNKFHNITIFKEIWQQYYPLLNENRVLSINLERCKMDKDSHFGKLLEEKNQIIANLAISVQQREKDIEERNNKIVSLSQAMQEKNLEIQHKNKEINFMKSSKFWKVREKYLQIKKVLHL